MKKMLFTNAVFKNYNIHWEVCKIVLQTIANLRDSRIVNICKDTKVKNYTEARIGIYCDN